MSIEWPQVSQMRSTSASRSQNCVSVQICQYIESLCAPWQVHAYAKLLRCACMLQSVNHELFGSVLLKLPSVSLLIPPMLLMCFRQRLSRDSLCYPQQLERGWLHLQVLQHLHVRYVVAECAPEGVPIRWSASFARVHIIPDNMVLWSQFAFNIADRSICPIDVCLTARFDRVMFWIFSGTAFYEEGIPCV